MRDPNRLDEFYDKLKQIHKENFPDWRFGQLVCNLERWACAKFKIRDMFYIEEQKMLSLIDEYVEEMKRWKGYCNDQTL